MSLSFHHGFPQICANYFACVGLRIVLEKKELRITAHTCAVFDLSSFLYSSHALPPSSNLYCWSETYLLVCVDAISHVHWRP